ncbi:hypothetical protein BBI15_06650 [Planococcus plakortidis]|uniref:Uncharacterized protein n=1 Tax=Planococcus plakortidis TaxID=1038856 RepID=A0A1C7E890_9BACL|nr:hypothetical protein [Planococcus plakortidis]ANU19915.1 hypothetical protein BBI15_06650 [Planococcus plakortidis]
MFGLSDFISLVISAFIILPLTILIRESGYLIASGIVGVENPRLTIGSGPRVFKIGILDVRKYYQLYSRFSYDSLKRDNKFTYIFLYGSPILMTLFLALALNALIANGILQSFMTFWDRFVFYAIFYLLFDVVPMKMQGGMPNNGMIIYEMLRYGKRTDFNESPFIPATSDVEQEQQDIVEKIEKRQKEQSK